ncbi:MAG: alpha/beta hydrolase [Bacteroidota bacterium]
MPSGHYFVLLGNYLTCMCVKQNTIYCIPGLGFDQRIFDGLRLSNCQLMHLKWLEPLKGEQLPDYARRMSQAIDKDEPITLLGYSFGGLVAQEIAAHRAVDKVLLLSSIKDRKELSPLFRQVAPWKLYLLFQKGVALRLLQLWGANHGFSHSETAFFRDMLSHLSNYYFQWGLRSISEWQIPKLPSATQVIHIHGTRDRPFPIRYLKNVDITVEGGDHMMIYKQPQVIAKILQRSF